MEILGFGGGASDSGLSDLQAAFEGGGVRSGMAALFLLAYHVLVQSFFALPHNMAEHASCAESILSTSLSRYPGSALFLCVAAAFSWLAIDVTTGFRFLNARLARLQGDAEKSERDFVACKRACPWESLQHLCCYEIVSLSSAFTQSFSYHGRVFV